MASQNFRLSKPKTRKELDQYVNALRKLREIVTAATNPPPTRTASRRIPTRQNYEVREEIDSYHTSKKTFYEFMIECYMVVEGNPTTRMITKSNTRLIGHISADRGTDESKNRESRKSLESDLQKHGIGYQKGVGEYNYSSGEGIGREVTFHTAPKPPKKGRRPMSRRRFGIIMRRLARKHGQESVITKDANKPAVLHTTERGSTNRSITLGTTQPGKHPQGYGETSGTKIRSGKLPKETTKPAYHYGEEDN